MQHPKKKEGMKNSIIQQKKEPQKCVSQGGDKRFGKLSIEHKNKLRKYITEGKIHQWKVQPLKKNQQGKHKMKCFKILPLIRSNKT